MELFNIAALKVRMDCGNGMLFERSRQYLAENQSDKADFDLIVPDEVLSEKKSKLPFTLDECRYVFYGEKFYYKLLDYNGMVLHASCVEKGGYAYLFSAKSGTGKSTHTHLWMDTLSDVHMVNDDKPAIRKIDGRFYACGTPFSGKNDESSNRIVPIRAIVFIERAEENSVERLTPAQAIPLFLSQTIRPSKVEGMDRMLSLLGETLSAVPAFRLKCNISEDAALTAYNEIEKYIGKEAE